MNNTHVIVLIDFRQTRGKYPWVSARNSNANVLSCTNLSLSFLSIYMLVEIVIWIEQIRWRYQNARLQILDHCIEGGCWYLVYSKAAMTNKPRFLLNKLHSWPDFRKVCIIQTRQAQYRAIHSIIYGFILHRSLTLVCAQLLITQLFRSRPWAHCSVLY